MATRGARLFFCAVLVAAPGQGADPAGEATNTDVACPASALLQRQAHHLNAHVEAGSLSETGDVTQLSLGISAPGGLMLDIISRNHMFPTKKSKNITRFYDNMVEATIEVYEGERAMVKDNDLLGRIKMTGLYPWPRDYPLVEVTMEINKEGILKVTATDLGSRRENSKHITIPVKGRLEQEKIDRMVKKAEELSGEDDAKKSEIEAKNGLETYCYEIQNLLERPKKIEIDKNDLEKIENTVELTLDWLGFGNERTKDEVEAKRATVEKIVNPIMTKAYLKADKSPRMPRV